MHRFGLTRRRSNVHAYAVTAVTAVTAVDAEDLDGLVARRLTIAVPIVIDGLMRHLHRLGGRLLTTARAS